MDSRIGTDPATRALWRARAGARYPAPRGTCLRARPQAAAPRRGTRIQRMRTDLERAALAESHRDLIQINQSGETLLADLLRLREYVQRHVRLEARAREVVESRHSELLCPIGRELLLYPVVADDGHTYERRNIEEHLAAPCLSGTEARCAWTPLSPAPWPLAARVAAGAGRPP